MKIKNVTVFGSGMLGTQIAYQTAYQGYNVTLYDINHELLEKGKVKFVQFKELYQQDLNAAPADLDAVLSRISFT
jgi:3-hydroxybutyryl-CoA dehydrogenase